MVTRRPNQGTIRATRTADNPPTGRKRHPRTDRAYRTDTDQDHLSNIDHDSFWEHVKAHQQERADARHEAL